MAEFLDNPLIFADLEHTGGKLRVYGPITTGSPPATVTKAFAFEITIFEDQKTEKEFWGVEKISSDAVRQPFTWKGFADIFPDAADVNEALANWGNIIEHDWYATIEPSDDTVIAVHTTPELKLELHKAWCKVLGRVGYVKIIPTP